MRWGRLESHVEFPPRLLVTQPATGLMVDVHRVDRRELQRVEAEDRLGLLWVLNAEVQHQQLLVRLGGHYGVAEPQLRDGVLGGVEAEVQGVVVAQLVDLPDLAVVAGKLRGAERSRTDGRAAARACTGTAKRRRR